MVRLEQLKLKKNPIGYEFKGAKYKDYDLTCPRRFPELFLLCNLLTRQDFWLYAEILNTSLAKIKCTCSLRH